MNRSTLRVVGMDCPEESGPIEHQLRSMDGVEEVHFNLIAGTVSVDHSLKPEDVAGAIRDLGFEVRTDSDDEDEVSKRGWRFWLTSCAGIFTALGLFFEHTGYPHSVFVPAYIGAMLTGGIDVACKGFRSIRRINLDVHVLMILAALGAVGIGAWSEGASVLFLFAVAQALERGSMDKARRSVRSLMALSPSEASVLRDGEESRAAVEEVAVGEIVRVRPGERIPLDGRVLSGASEVNQAPITGESLPVSVSPGDTVLAGTINGQGSVEFTVTRRSEETTLSQIVHLVEEAQASRAPSQRFVERFAKIYTPVVLCAAVAVMTIPSMIMGLPFEDWFYRSLVLMVIACPCALVISTPVSIVSALAGAARSGVLIKGGAHLETLGRVRSVLFDKTGTLTEGRPGVDEVVSLNNVPAVEILRLAASLEVRSEHRLAQAILEAAHRDGVELLPSKHFQAMAGLGARAEVQGKTFLLGNHRLIEEFGLCGPDVESVLEGIEGDGRTAVVLADQTRALGVISISDRLRGEGPKVVEELKDDGIVHIGMLTGDNEITAQVVANRLGIEDFRAERLPKDKVDEVRDAVARYGVVAMVGDGINDAPALATASVGVAMGSGGTDAALETADAVLMGDDLTKLSWAIRLGRRTLSVIRQNVVFSIGIKAVFLALAIPGLATLWMAVAADMGASLLVIANGMRLLRGNR